MAFSLRRLAADDMDTAAAVMRTAFDARLPWLAGLHTPDEDRAFFRDRLSARCTLWGAFDAEVRLAGFIAFRPGWIEQLYVLPRHQGRGMGDALLRAAMARQAELSLWTFQKNLAARRFYERRGFLLLEETDGAANEEREADALYRWRADRPPLSHS